MNIVKRTQEPWDPFDMLLDLQSEMNHAFNRSLTHKDQWARGFEPSIEVREEADHYILQTDLPGLKREDFNISVKGNQLTLKGERKYEKETQDKEKGYFYSERSFGAFSRTLEFPTEIQADKVKAAYKDGVLEVALPKVESSQPKQINVEVK
ncbi:MAG: Hsp20/alpha crystallin family protein [Candidatus Omnitrophota bacterium]|jgi:HSP20 family protein